ncbi:cadherin domain-containing protein [Zhouia spongiae]|uniref:Cadherin domain-containing protein n=1 Tax=Zhouia spongiae TaxID=2202721 RepID=A0ABY3YMW4_9FLAO|nr:cadherin repeat domain-containing protein [Zhouia spongiae]UNY99023.1 cadherin domain-containing protein [Zhouia spongiae]
MKLFKKGVLLSFITIQLIACSKDDEPQNTPPVIKAQSFTVAEDKAASSNIGAVTAIDVDKDDLTFKIIKNDNDLFAVNTSGNLSITANKSLDYETQTKHEITLEVSDGKDKASAVITINVTDVNENSPISIADQSFTVAEDIGLGGLAGKLNITDPDDDVSTFSIKNGNDDGLFTINSFGEIRMNKKLDYETTTIHTLNIEVNDANGSSDNATITINVTNVNDVVPTVTVTGPFTVNEDIDDTVIIGQVQATDVEGDNLTYSLTSQSTTGNLFAINANSGELSLITGENLDYETATQHTVHITVFDGKHYVFDSVIIYVTDVVETGGTIVNIPDANFKAVLVANTTINTNGDSEIQVTEANNYVGSIHIQSKGINDLTGIEEFVKITELQASNNSLINIDLSKNTELTVLHLALCGLTSIDISKNTKLEDVSFNINQLTSLNFSSHTNLKKLSLENNKLTSLNLANGSNNNMTLFEVRQNPSLTCIKIDAGFTVPADGSWNKDAIASYNTTCP